MNKEDKMENECNDILKNAVTFESAVMAALYASKRETCCVTSMHDLGYFHIWHPRSDVYVICNRLSTPDEQSGTDFAQAHSVRDLANFLFECGEWNNPSISHEVNGLHHDHLDWEGSYDFLNGV